MNCNQELGLGVNCRACATRAFYIVVELLGLAVLSGRF